MSVAASQPAFPFARAAIALTLAAAFMLAQACWFVPWLCGPDAMIQKTVFIVFAMVWLASILSIAPVALLGSHGVMAAAYGYFIGMAIRLPLCLGGVLILNRRAGMSPGPLVAALAMSYLPLLAIEATYIGRYLWSKDFLGPTKVPGNSAPPSASSAVNLPTAPVQPPALELPPQRSTEVPA